MMALLFFIILLAVIFAWVGKRAIALKLFAVTMILSSLFFLHHITTHLLLQL